MSINFVFNFVVCKPIIDLHKTKSVQYCCFNDLIHETITIILNLKIFESNFNLILIYLSICPE